MTGLLDSIAACRTGLQASQAGIQVTGHNISNADTLGYHRQRLVTTPAEPALQRLYAPFTGLGVVVDGSTRTADGFLGAAVSRATGQSRFASTGQSLLLQVEQVAGSVGEDGLGAALSTFFSKLSALSASPSDATARAEVLGAASTLGSTFNRMASGLHGIVDQADAQVGSTVTSINEKSARVAALNAKIIEAESSGQEASDLRDQRDLAIRELAGLSGAIAFESDSGQMTILLGGQTLVQGDHAATLSSTQGTDGRTVVRVTDGGVPSRVLDLGDGAEAGGQLGALLSVQDTLVGKTMPRLDQLAYDLATAVNTQHGLGYDQDGNPGGDLFEAPTAVSGAAAALSVDPGLTARGIAAAGSSTAAAGDNANALALLGLASEKNAGGGTATFTAEASDFVGEIGALGASMQSRADLAADALSNLQTLEQSEVGVDLDQEMMQLIQYQRSYQSAVKLLSVLDDLQGQILDMVR
jgi:flagellar hook-associated protein 1